MDYRKRRKCRMEMDTETWSSLLTLSPSYIQAIYRCWQMKGWKFKFINALNSVILSSNNQTGCQAWNLPTLLQKFINSPWAPWIIYTWPPSVFPLFSHSSALGQGGKIPFQVSWASPLPWTIGAGISLPSSTWINMLCITLLQKPLQYFTCLLIYLPLAKRWQAAQGQKLHVTFSSIHISSLIKPDTKGSAE